MTRLLRPVLVAATVLAATASAHAFPPAVATNGPLTIEIAPLSVVEITSPPREIEVSVTLKNVLAQPLDGTLAVVLTDGWKVTRNPSPAFALAGNATQTITLGVTPAPGSHAALYPIHATARFTRHGSEESPAQNQEQQVHAVLIVSTRRAPALDAPGQLTIKAQARGATPLLSPRAMQPRWTLDATPQNVLSRPPGIVGEDKISGAFLAFENASRPDARLSLAMHPPWRAGAGEAMADFRVQLPRASKLALRFATAIRDSVAGEPQSDGVQFRVSVDDGGGFRELFSRFSTSKAWQDGRVDLSKFAGKSITLRLQSGPGPARDTSVDLSYWSAPTILAGDEPAPESATSRQRRRARALSLARAARSNSDKTSPWAWTLRSEALTGPASEGGASIVPGPAGLRDAFIAFSDANRELVFEGFELAIDTSEGRRAIGRAAGELAPARLASTWSGSGNHQGTLSHVLSIGGREISLRARVWAQGGALRIAWSLPNIAPDSRGFPRIARIALGPASSPIRRAYAGFGNVLQDPGRWTLNDGGFRLSTRHVGADYRNGLSLVQASDIFPDAFEVDGPRGLASLAVHHNATLSLIPSSRGAFAGARVWRALSGFKAAGGVHKLLGKMALDQWGGDYAQAATDLQRAADYGLTDAVFVKHVWQRWGYDFRLPDIFPPAGDQAAFLAMVRAAKRNGILFCPHDNYIDFYPDAEGFSYRNILFNADGTPQLAWLNEGPGAQSYRWSPLSFGPFLERNLALVKGGFGPTSYFVDVFSAIAPFDFHDASGRFHPKMEMQARWGNAFDRIRQVLGDDAPTISEAGADALIGHLDGGESDHAAWIRPGSVESKAGVGFGWELEAGDGERVPWHDMATHGRFVLLAGGLGDRYASGGDARLHGYASDDYLSLTILGGRNPMCDGPFSRRAVMTYWLLHDISARLAHLEMTAHQFAGDDIHRQSVSWADEKGAPAASVQVNRGASDWSVGGKGSTRAPQVLPRYGFAARAGSGARELRADISRRSGVISAFAQDGVRQLLFADARPEKTSEGAVRARVLGVRDLGAGRLGVDFEWQVLAAIPTKFVPFVHFTSKEAANENIAFQGEMDFSGVNLSKPGLYRATATATLPAEAEGKSFGIRFGLFDPTGGERFSIASPSENGRVRGGQISVRAGSTGSVPSYAPEADASGEALRARLNVADKILDFGPLSTNGSLRLDYAASTWTLTPLPDSGAFSVRLDLARLRAGGRRVTKVEARAESGSVSALKFELKGARVAFEVPGRTRSVSIVLR